MIAELERRMAEVLGPRLPAPFLGAVVVLPGDAAATPLVRLGVRSAQPLDEEFGRPPEPVPGASDPRRVVRLGCTIGLAVRGADRAQVLAGIDALVYALDAPDLRDGSALKTDSGDPGFLVDQVRLTDAGFGDGGEGALLAAARGWFWPVGAAGESGVRIGEIRVRGAVLPILLAPSSQPVAGGPPITLTLSIPGSTGLVLTPAAPPAVSAHGAPMPFGRFAARAFGAGRRPATGVLAGGTDGSDGSRLFDLTAGAASLTYTPPATATVEELVVGIPSPDGALGLEVGHFPLRVRRS